MQNLLTQAKRFLWALVLLILGLALFLYSKKTRDRKMKSVYKVAGLAGIGAAVVFVILKLKKSN